MTCSLPTITMITHLNQCWITGNWTTKQWNFNWKTIMFIVNIAFINVCKMSSCCLGLNVLFSHMHMLMQFTILGVEIPFDGLVSQLIDWLETGVELLSPMTYLVMGALTFVFVFYSFILKLIVTCRPVLSMWGKIMLPMHRLWLHSLYGLHEPCHLLSEKGH